VVSTLTRSRLCGLTAWPRVAVDQPGELHQRVAQVDLLAETGTPEVLGWL